MIPRPLQYTTHDGVNPALRLYRPLLTKENAVEQKEDPWPCHGSGDSLQHITRFRSYVSALLSSTEVTNCGGPAQLKNIQSG